MFDTELFYKICEQYNVELSNQYDKPMINVNGKIKEIKDNDIRKLLYEEDEVGEFNSMN
jgi:hypothetical protein